MTEKILLAVWLLLGLYGLAHGLVRLSYRLLFPHKAERILLLLPLHGKREDVEYVLRRLAALRWFLPSGNVGVTPLDCGLETETERLAQQSCEQLRMTLYREEALPELVHTSLQGGEKTL